MIYTALTNKALRLAYAAHHGQVDDSGVPYIFHPCHLAEQMPDEVTACTALLHDVAEDTAVTLEELEGEFPRAVIDALRLLTHAPGTDYFAYVRAIRSNPIARMVKLADLAHNADLNRFAGCADISAGKLERRREKYLRARAILEEWPFLVRMMENGGLLLGPEDLERVGLRFAGWAGGDGAFAAGMRVRPVFPGKAGEELLLLPGQDYPLSLCGGGQNKKTTFRLVAPSEF